MLYSANSQNLVENSSLGASFALGGNFGEQQTHKSSFIPKISSKYKTSTANTRIFDLKNADSANQTQIAESALDSAESQNLIKNNRARSANPYKSFCYFWLLPKVESPLSFNYNLPNKVDLQNLQGGLPRRFCEYARNDEYFLNVAFFAESTSNLRGSIFDEKSGLRSHERGNKTFESIDEASGKSPRFIAKRHSRNKG